MSALNDFYENRKLEFTELELDKMENELKMTTYEMDWSFLLKQEIMKKIDKKFGVNGFNALVV